LHVKKEQNIDGREALLECQSEWNRNMELLTGVAIFMGFAKVIYRYKLGGKCEQSDQPIRLQSSPIDFTELYFNI
jgi:hypothetical protein